MRRLRLLSALIILALAAVSLVGFVALVRVITDGLNRYPTIAKLKNVRTAWDHGQAVEAARALAQASWMVLEGGARWQAAEYYMAQSASYKHNKQMMEAVKACDKANTVLGPYDNGWEMDYYCDWMVWDLDTK